MKLTGSRQLAARRADVWAKLNDPDVLRRCIPGCESLERVTDTELKAIAALKLGPMNARFTGTVTLSDIKPTISYRISGKGSAGPLGQASGGANVSLADAQDGTLLAYDVDANVSGKIAQLGQRLIEATAKQMADQFFTKFAAEFGPLEAPVAEAQGSAVPVWVILAIGACVLALAMALLAF